MNNKVNAHSGTSEATVFTIMLIESFQELSRAARKYLKGHHKLCRAKVFSGDRKCTCGYQELKELLEGGKDE